jgi:predicted nucleic acid-binding protein
MDHFRGTLTEIATAAQRVQVALDADLSAAKRRIPAADYLIAAAAASQSAGVLHYDHHFDPLCRALGIESVWVAEPGSID